MNDEEQMDRFDEGYAAGHLAGLAEGHAMGYAAGNAAGVIEAMESSLIAPDNEFFAAGYKAGVADTRRLPQATYQEGWDDGYSEGYDVGLRDGTDE